MTLLLFILILGLIIFIHELGHFLFAKMFKIHVFEFSLGFGPKLFSFRRKNDETEYMVRLIPLGGYVALAGETYEDDKDIPEKDRIPDDKKLYNKSFIQKILVMVAGVFNNFVLGFVLLFIMGLVYGSYFTTNKLDGINESYPLYKAGARDGDRIVAINNHKIYDYDDIQTWIAITGGKATLNITVEKEDKTKETYKVKPEYDKESDKYYYGIVPETIDGNGVIGAFKFAGTKLLSILKQLVQVIICLFTGKLGINSVSGPVGIYQVVGMAKSSIYSLLFLTAYLSINVGFMNLLPFPAFDGGRAFLLIIEKITGKKVPLKVETIINNIGFYILIGLMIFITIKDILNLF